METKCPRLWDGKLKPLNWGMFISNSTHTCQPEENVRFPIHELRPHGTAKVTSRDTHVRKNINCGHAKKVFAGIPGIPMPPRLNSYRRMGEGLVRVGLHYKAVKNQPQEDGSKQNSWSAGHCIGVRWHTGPLSWPLSSNFDASDAATQTSGFTT